MAAASKNTFPGKSPVVLALETATACGSVALVADDSCIAEFSLHSGLTHSRRLLQGVEYLMREAACGWDDIDVVAISTGPGSFTGLRIGMSTAKGFAMAADKKLVGISTLDGLASQLHSTRQMICPVLDARKNEVYAAFYRSDADGTVQRVTEYMAIDPQALGRMVREPTIFIGDGVGLCAEIFDRLGEMAIVPPAGIFFPRAAVIGTLAVASWKRNEVLAAATAVPLYGRPSDAEIQFGGSRHN